MKQDDRTEYLYDDGKRQSFVWWGPGDALGQLMQGSWQSHRVLLWLYAELLRLAWLDREIECQKMDWAVVSSYDLRAVDTIGVGRMSFEVLAGSPELSSSAGEGVRAKIKNYAVEPRYVQTMCGRYRICALET